MRTSCTSRTGKSNPSSPNFHTSTLFIWLLWISYCILSCVLILLFFFKCYVFILVYTVNLIKFIVRVAWKLLNLLTDQLVYASVLGWVCPCVWNDKSSPSLPELFEPGFIRHLNYCNGCLKERNTVANCKAFLLYQLQNVAMKFASLQVFKELVEVFKQATIDSSQCCSCFIFPKWM